METLLSALKRYTSLSGRAGQVEFGTIYLLTLLIGLAFALAFGGSRLVIPGWPGHYVQLIAGPGVASALLTLILCVPVVSTAVRRLHDQSRSGWWLLIIPMLLPWLGQSAFVAVGGLLLGPGVTGPNSYGPDPRGQSKSIAHV